MEARSMTAEPPLQVEEAGKSLSTSSARPAKSSMLSCANTCTHSFSLKRTADEGLTPEQFRSGPGLGSPTLIDVIKQEMLHLALATNILTAIGAAAPFRAPQTCSILSRGYPPGVQDRVCCPFMVSRALAPSSCTWSGQEGMRRWLMRRLSLLG